jgi:hypothetical protein
MCRLVPKGRAKPGVTARESKWWRRKTFLTESSVLDEDCAPLFRRQSDAGGIEVHARLKDAPTIDGTGMNAAGTARVTTLTFDRSDVESNYDWLWGCNGTEVRRM